MNGDARYWQTATAVCTPAELEALTLRDRRNMSPRTIAMTLGISRWTVRDRLDNADRKIHHAMHNSPQEPAA